MVWRIDGRGCGEAEWKNTLATIPAKFSHDFVIGQRRRLLQFDKDPFLTDRAREVFRDTEIGCQTNELACNKEYQACPPG
jgi:hypothetical protein